MTDKQRPEAQPASTESTRKTAPTHPPSELVSHLPGDPPDLTSVRRMWADDAASAHLGMEATLIEVDHAVV